MSTFINSFWGGVVIPIVGEITLSSTSVLASWSPETITNTTPTLVWSVSGGLIIAPVTINDPTFNFSGNTGTANILIDNTINLTEVRMRSLELVTADFTGANSISIINVQNNLITSINLLGNINLLNLRIDNNPTLTTIDLSANTLLTNFDSQQCGYIGAVDLTNNTNLLTVNLRFCPSLTSVDVTGLTTMNQLLIAGCSLNAFDISTNTSLSILSCNGNLFTITMTNKLLADIVSNGVINGTLDYRNNETGQGITDRAILITRGWTIRNRAT